MTKQKKQQLKRGAGILMPISALPSKYGIGTLGKESYRFVDFLKRIGCKYWQVLPVGPTSFGDSPYQSFSAFAGNPYFIDLEYLILEGLLDPDEAEQYKWQETEDTIDYALIYEYRFQVLKKVFLRSNHQEMKEYLNFIRTSEYWLKDYSLFMALKNHFGNREWLLWDEDIRYRFDKAVLKYEVELKEEIEFWKFVQFKFWQQWNNLKEYTNQNGVQIIGDIPLYVALDSADVWVHGELFELDERKTPINVAGVPPDAFSDDGQRWGNPLYRWEEVERQEFTWWRERMLVSAVLYDVIRVDHFIGVVNYYSIPVYCETAVGGSWRIGPGRKLTEVIKESIGTAKIIAEDLGVLTANVVDLIEETGYPGMKIIEFGLDGPVENDYLPHNYKSSNTVAYTGTHDNETLVGFLNKKTDKELEYLCKYFNVKGFSELPFGIIKILYASVADVVIVQMQDLLELDNDARMNFPSTVGGNWKWRLKSNQYDELKEEILLELACIYGR
jgi:4-alpha-glucanotransferase